MVEKKPKILMVVLCFLPESVGGSEVYTYQLSQELIRRGYEVTVLAGLQDTTLERYRVIDTAFEGIRVVKIVNSFAYATTFIDFFIDPHVDAIFRSIVSKEKPDVIHFQHLPYLSGNLPEIAKQMNIPSIFTLHDYWYFCFRSQLLRPGLGPCPGPSGGVYCASCNDAVVPNPVSVGRIAALKKIIQLPLVRRLNLSERVSPKLKQRIKTLLYRRPVRDDDQAATHIQEHTFRFDFFKRQFQFPDSVLSPSYHLKKRYEAEGYREILHMPLGFRAIHKVERLPFRGKVKIAYLGNMTPFKGAQVILREYLRLRKKEAVEIHFHGRQNYQQYFDEMKNLAQQCPKGSIAFHGAYRSDKELRKILSKVHVVVFPSLWEENYPLVVREALLYGVPVIGSNLGGVPEAIEDGVNGFLFDPYAEGSLAEKIERILKSPAILQQMTEGARNTKIESMDDHVTKMTTIYNDAMSK